MNWHGPDDWPDDLPQDDGWSEEYAIRWPLTWRGLLPRERWLWFERLWTDVCELRVRYRLGVRSQDRVLVADTGTDRCLLARLSLRFGRGVLGDRLGRLSLDRLAVRGGSDLGRRPGGVSAGSGRTHSGHQAGAAAGRKQPRQHSEEHRDFALFA